MTKSHNIDLNADIGEGMPHDEDLIKYISSCNIACGGHAGDDVSISKTIKLAQQNKLKIGAHPSYPDQDNFGRKTIDISIDNLVASIDMQLENFKTHIEQTNANWHHIKFHGALYNDLKYDIKKAKALTQLIREKYSGLSLYIPPNSVIQETARDQITVHMEGFADRRYNDDLGLISRNEKNAVLHEEEVVIQQVINMITRQNVKSISLKTLAIQVDTICIHGDNPQALKLTEKIVTALKNSNITIR